jgi:hypothetical protein
MKVNNKRVRKFKGGGADMGDPGRAQERADRGYGSTAGVDRSAVGPGSNYANNVAALTSKTTKTGNATPKTFSPVTTGLNLAGSIIGKVPGVGYAFQGLKTVGKAIQKSTRTKTARGETIFGNVKTGNAGMPITRDYYRTEGTPLDVMSPKGTQYMKDAGFLKGPKPTTDGGGGEDNRKSLCPDGTNPPCKLPATQIKNPVSTPNTFLSGFKAYDDGGEVIISSNVDKSLL